MERRFEVRLDELMAACQVEPEMFEGLTQRLEEFVEPFAQAVFRRRESKQHAQTYVAGLLSDLKHKNTKSIAYRHNRPPGLAAVYRLSSMGPSSAGNGIGQASQHTLGSGRRGDRLRSVGVFQERGRFGWCPAAMAGALGEGR